MSWQQIAISAPIIFIFAYFALKLISLNNKQTNAFLKQLKDDRAIFLDQLKCQATIFDGRNDALIKSLAALDASHQEANKAIVQALSCVVSQINFLAQVLLKHDIRSSTSDNNLAVHLGIPAPTEVAEAWQALANVTRQSKKRGNAANPPT